MSPPATSPFEAEGPCDDRRREASAACASVPAARAAAAAAAAAADRARTRLLAAEGALASAQRLSDARITDQAKEGAQDAYRRAIAAATGPAEEQAAITVWMRDVDRLNREGHSARASLEAARVQVAEAHGALTVSSEAANTERIRAEGVVDRCLATRRRLAECVEGSAGTEPADETERPDPREWAESPDADRSAGPERGLVIERLVSGDRRLLREVAARTAEQTGSEQGSWVLLLQELLEAIADRAAQEGFLDFDSSHPFWGQFDRQEARLIVRALSSVGARVDGQGAWAGGRRAGPAQLAMALAHVGYEARGVRGVPTVDGMGTLFEGVRVGAGELLATRAPSLTMEQMFTLLGDRADRLGELWDHWGSVRPQLLAEAPD